MYMYIHPMYMYRMVSRCTMYIYIHMYMYMYTITSTIITTGHLYMSFDEVRP